MESLSMEEIVYQNDASLSSKSSSKGASRAGMHSNVPNKLESLPSLIFSTSSCKILLQYNDSKEQCIIIQFG